jgi:hypothetical protein
VGGEAEIGDVGLERNPVPRVSLRVPPSGMLTGHSSVILDVMQLTRRFSITLASALFIVAAGTATGDEEMLQPGQPFPAFKLPAHDGSTVSSADLEGSPYLLFFYPKADTGG